MTNIKIVHCDRIDEWLALYVDGKCKYVGDSVDVFERLMDEVGAEYMEGDFLLGGNHRKDIALSLDDIHAYTRRGKVNQQKADELRREANKLLEEANRLAEW